jgi:hypothetical protein
LGGVFLAVSGLPDDWIGQDRDKVLRPSSSAFTGFGRTDLSVGGHHYLVMERRVIEKGQTLVLGIGVPDDFSV